MLQIINNGNCNDLLMYEDNELNLELSGQENKMGNGPNVHISAIYLDNIDNLNKQYCSFVIESKSIGINKRFVKIYLTITDMTLDNENYTIQILVEVDPIYGVERDIGVNGIVKSDRGMSLIKSRFDKIKQVINDNLPKDGKFLGLTSKRDLDEFLKLVDSDVILGVNENKTESVQPTSN